MKKLLAVLLVLGSLTLIGCGEAVKSEIATTEVTTTTEKRTTLDPNRPVAIIEPLQGGLMLYTFQGAKMHTWKEGGEKFMGRPAGLINQDGKLVCDPEHRNVEYIYDDNFERVIGMIAITERKITLYQLDGTSRVLSCEGYRFHVFPGGRYASVTGAVMTEKTITMGNIDDGLFDIKNDRYVIEPKEGQIIQYLWDGMVRVNQYKSAADMEGEPTTQLLFNCADESIKEGAFEWPGWPNRTEEWNKWIFRCADGSAAEGIIHRMGFPSRRTPEPVYQNPLPDLRQFEPQSMPSKRSRAEVVLICDDFIIVYTSYEHVNPNEFSRLSDETFIEHVETFAIDWDGNRISDCPLEPYFDSLGSMPITAGEQDPNYFWVEHDNKRGYINTKGVWLFVDQP